MSELDTGSDLTLPDAYTARTADASRPRPSTGGLLLSLVVAVAACLVAFDGGGYALTSRNTIAVVLLWMLAVAVALGLWPRAAVPRAAIAVAGLLGAFALWTGLSAFWSPSVEKSFDEFDRVVLFLALFLVVVVSCGRGRGARAWLRGLGLAIAAVGVAALAARLFPDRFGGTSAVSLATLFPSGEARLSYPVEYWNGLATLVALGVPCLLFCATTERRVWARALAVLPLPALGAALYLTSSRGGIGVAAVAAVVFLALTDRRWLALATILVAGGGALAAFAIVHARDAVVAGPLAPDAASEGHSAALLVALACVATAVVHAVVSSLPAEMGAASRPVGWALTVLAAIAVVAAIVVADPGTRFEDFKALPPSATADSIQAHLASGSGNGRWQLWQAANEQFAGHRAVGEGAGTYEAWWAEHGTLPIFVRDAHSLYLETLGELGVVGLVLLGGGLLVGLVTGIRRVFGSRGTGRAACAALVAAYVAWLLEAGIDWMWETTVVTLVAVACLGLLVGPATRRRGGAGWPRSRPRRPVAIAARAAATVGAIFLVAAEGIPLVAQVDVGRSQDAAASGDTATALSAAAGAERVQPWAASTHLQRALVEEVAGDLPAAKRAIDRALDLDARDWRLWLVAARIETKLEHFAAAEHAFRRAIELNPRSPRFAGLPGAAG